MQSEILTGVLEQAGARLGENDRSFARRVFSRPLAVYSGRLSALGLVGRGRVVDAGCGFGQWSLALARLNRQVDAVDIARSRLFVLERLAKGIGVDNLQTHCSRLEELPFNGASADGIVCYGAIFSTDWKMSLREFARVLKPEGRLYVTGCGLGWYLHLWKHRPNAATDYDPRETAARSFQNTLDYVRYGRAPEGGPLIIEREEMVEEMQRAGLRITACGDEGTLHLDESVPPPHPFFQGTYGGYPGCYEIVADKCRA